MSRDILDLSAPPADQRLTYGPDPLQLGDLRRPSGAGPHPIVVAIHGGFWRNRHGLDYFGHACEALRGRGLATWNVEYRRIGDPGGAWPGTFLDVALATDHLRQIAPRYGLDLDRVVALGHSAGGHLACWLAGRQRIAPGDPLHTAEPLPIRGVVSLAGVVDLRHCWELHLSDNVVEQLMGGSPDRYPARYASGSPAELLPLGVPQALVHGTADQNVPFAISQRYQAAAAAHGDDARLVALPGAGHFEVVDPRSEEWPRVVDEVLRLLR